MAPILLPVKPDETVEKSSRGTMSVGNCFGDQFLDCGWRSLGFRFCLDARRLFVFAALSEGVLVRRRCFFSSLLSNSTSSLSSNSDDPLSTLVTGSKEGGVGVPECESISIYSNDGEGGPDSCGDEVLPESCKLKVSPNTSCRQKSVCIGTNAENVRPDRVF